MSADENVKETLEKLKKMGYDIEEYDQGYIACILDRSKIQDSKGKENEENESVRNREGCTSGFTCKGHTSQEDFT